MLSHTYIKRAKCDCGYLWTNPGSPSVGCLCGGSIVDNEIVSGDPVTDEADFKQFVADDLGIDVNDLELIEGTE